MNNLYGEILLMNNKAATSEATFTQFPHNYFGVLTQVLRYYSRCVLHVLRREKVNVTKADSVRQSANKWSSCLLELPCAFKQR